jgi:ABC-type transporter Mla subunit MlaD
MLFEKKRGGRTVRLMPTIFRFLIIIGAVAGFGYWSLYLLATRFEPQPREVVEPIGNVKIKKQ